MSIPILELPSGFGWGTPYKALHKYFASINPKNLSQIAKLKLHNSFGFYFEAKWKKYTYKATLYFNVKSERFTHVDIVIPGSIKKFDPSDFVRTFNLLKNEFGEPNIHRGMSLNALMKTKNYYAKKTEDLPRFVWILGNSEIVHCFIDHWGNGPVTIIRKAGK